MANRNRRTTAEPGNLHQDQIISNQGSAVIGSRRDHGSDAKTRLQQYGLGTEPPPIDMDLATVQVQNICQVTDGCERVVERHIHPVSLVIATTRKIKNNAHALSRTPPAQSGWG